jgi:hypothetical protein
MLRFLGLLQRPCRSCRVADVFLEPVPVYVPGLSGGLLRFVIARIITQDFLIF